MEEPIYYVTKIESKDPNAMIYDISSWRPKVCAYMQQLLSQEMDLDYAEASLNQMFFQKDTSLIDGILMNTAIERVVKCFEISRGSRPKLDATKVFHIYAREIGETDLTMTYEKCRKARNKVIAHDQETYLEGACGIIVEQESDKAKDLFGYSVQTKYLYEENKDTLLRLIHVAKRYIGDQKELIKKKLVDEYNAEHPQLTKLEIQEGVLFNNSW